MSRPRYTRHQPSRNGMEAMRRHFQQRPATGPVTAKEVRELMAVALKTDEELHPDHGKEITVDEQEGT